MPTDDKKFLFFLTTLHRLSITLSQPPLRGQELVCLKALAVRCIFHLNEQLPLSHHNTFGIQVKKFFFGIKKKVTELQSVITKHI